MRIALSGKIASGKSTFAKQLQIRLTRDTGNQTVILSFASRLKELATELFDYDEKKSKNRELLQEFGAAIRKIDTNAWIKSLNNRIKALDPKTNVIIDDLRMVNEFHFCKTMGFKLVRLEIDPSIQRGRILALYTPAHLERLNDVTETALDSFINEFDVVFDTNQYSLDSIMQLLN